ncbi:unnamed protein product [Ilex paraguariensis]|uniref:Uncharacterized protein n=1 Tax=Ilex paraguariensis TaxID=185542 RepID=A0ABC8TA05_9AQUA
MEIDSRVKGTGVVRVEILVLVVTVIGTGSHHLVVEEGQVVLSDLFPKGRHRAHTISTGIVRRVLPQNSPPPTDPGGGPISVAGHEMGALIAAFTEF